MKISLNWLRDYIKTDKSVHEICQILTNTGLEVEKTEKIESVKGGLEGVFVGYVEHVSKHQDADRLNIAEVNIGNEKLQIVCGAPNLKKGQKVPVAIVGTTLFPTPKDSFKIKKSKIRGVESFGMICAEDEMGIGKNHDGIMILDDSVPVGKPVKEVLDFEDDYLIEIGLTPNRADGMGHIGVARDLKAFLNVHENKNIQLEFPAIHFKEGVESNTIVSVENKKLCPRYTGVEIEGVQVKESPKWLQNRLKNIGLSPINNVVDVTNYVMYEFGNPLHAFDLEKINGNILLQNVSDNKKLICLDEVERELSSKDLMICNAKETICIAGVLGGLDFGISENTTKIFLESAYFDSVSVRQTAKRYGLNTDASFRFERGVNPDTILDALKRASDLIIQISGGEVTSKIYDTNPTLDLSHEINFNYLNCYKLIGLEIKKEIIDKILTELDIEIVSKKNNDLVLKVPAYRVDVKREVDVIEEILRIYGFNNIPVTQKLNASLSYSKKINPENIQNKIADLLSSNGFNEIFNNSLTSSKLENEIGDKFINPDLHVKILNPLSLELDVLRQTMLFSGLKSMEYNINRKKSNLKFFEFGKTYHKKENNYQENIILSLFISGQKKEESWNNQQGANDYYSIRGIVSSIIQRLGLSKNIQEKEYNELPFEYGVKIDVAKKTIAKLGLVKKSILKKMGIKQDVYYAKINWETVLDLQVMNKIKFKAIPKTMSVRRDFSLLLDNKIHFSQIREVAFKVEKKLLKSVGLFDVYEGKNLPKNKKSYAVSFIFQDEEKTLKDNQVDFIMNKIRMQLESNLNAELR